MTEATETTILPLFYKEPVPLNADDHRTLTVSPSPGGYAFASDVHNIMLSTVEFYEACRDYAIIFSNTADGDITPLVLLGVQAGENLFVDEAGAWKANYIPAYVRRYPFIPADNGTTQFPICIDNTFDGLNIEGGQRIFDDNGEPTDFCRHIQAFVMDYMNQQAPSYTFTAKLKELELFRAMDANIQLNDGRQFLMQGFLVVDEEKLARLGDGEVLDLFRKGYLGLIYAHLTSIKNLGRLTELKSAKA